MAEKGRKIVLDTETTGLSAFHGHRLIEVACVEIIDGELTGNHYHTYINPKRDVPKDAYEIHGIATEFLYDKPVFPKIADDFLSFIGTSELVIHNAPFDMGFLNHELSLVGHNHIPMNRVIDTLQLARKLFPGAPASLDALCERFNISLSKRHKHGALIDAELLAIVYLYMRASRQGKLTFSGEKKIVRQARPARSFPATAAELEDHKKLLKKISNPLWLTDKAKTGQ
ncbi:MAG: DNA polymerase III subunit epsilon [Proteobacteria bacterium]|nr:DNA polymerase III subunit epsilon [Pseudomonadota bacterium]